MPIRPLYDDDTDRYDDWFVANAPPEALTPPATILTPTATTQPVATAPGPTTDVEDATGGTPDYSIYYGQTPEEIVRNVIRDFQLTGRQADPTSLEPLVAALQANGYNATLDTRTDNLHKGIMLDGRFIKLLDGYDNWIWLPDADIIEGGGGGAEGGDRFDTGGMGGAGGGIDTGGMGGAGGGIDTGVTDALAQALTAGEAPLVAPWTEPPPEPTPWTESFQYPSFLPPEPFSYPEFAGPEPFSYPGFEAPTGEAVFEDPGYQIRLREGQRALENAAAAKGTLLTGGTLKGLQQFASDLASQEYGQAYGRKASEYERAQGNAWRQYLQDYGARTAEFERGRENAWQQYQQQRAADVSDYERDYSQALADYERRYGTSLDNERRALEDFTRRYNITIANQDRPFNKLTTLADLGQVTTPYLAFGQGAETLGLQGANAWSDYLTNAANARAAGQVVGGNAASNVFSNVTNPIWQWLVLQNL